MKNAHCRLRKRLIGRNVARSQRAATTRSSREFTSRDAGQFDSMRIDTVMHGNPACYLAELPNCVDEAHTDREPEHGCAICEADGELDDRRGA